MEKSEVTTAYIIMQLDICCLSYMHLILKCFKNLLKMTIFLTFPFTVITAKTSNVKIDFLLNFL